MKFILEHLSTPYLKIAPKVWVAVGKPDRAKVTFLHKLEPKYVTRVTSRLVDIQVSDDIKRQLSTRHLAAQTISQPLSQTANFLPLGTNIERHPPVSLLF